MIEKEYLKSTHPIFRHTSGDHDRATLIMQLINKHQEQKEAFLKVNNCIFRPFFEVTVEILP